jgi:S1-C subfamily serine protease
MILRVTTADRTEYPAAIVGLSPDHDLAVIQVSAPKDKLVPIQLATSSDLKEGQKVFAIGNPFDLSLTLTTGIVSALGRTIESDKQRGAPITGAIQHQAPINPGNSGGPLLNRFGKLIGVNTSITSPSGGNVGIGFAIPSDTVNQVVTEIIRTGRTVKPDLGVRLYDQRRLRAAGYDQGVMIAEVIPGGPADQAKLRGLRRNPDTGRAEPGDIILAINGQTVNGVDDFQKIVAGLKPGQQVKVKYLRVEGNNEAEKEATVTVGGV